MKTVIFFLTLSFILTGAQDLIAQKEHAMHQKSMLIKAVALITPTRGNTAHGIVTFENTENGIHIVAELSGLKPGKHGFHIHEFGNITSDDGSSAGGHFNPMNMPHSMPASEKRHAGDMGNITADEKGNARLDYMDPVIELDGNNSIIGHSVVVHENEDDLMTQPTGNAGPRIGYGVIGIAK
jgi:Cu-Zn family superoxide dismutase